MRTRVIEASEPGDASVLRVVDLETPKPAAGQVLVAVEAAGVNFIDTYQRSGLYKVERPVRMGMEGAGVVEAVGEGVTALAVGDRVAWSSVQGSYATHVVAPIDKLVKLPDGVSSEIAAAAMLQGMTAHYLSHDTFPLRAGHTCLVQAAAGGVGLLLCQMAKRLGARVIGTVSTEAKAKLAREAGADHVILYTKEDFSKETRALTNGVGVDVVYDSVGRTTFEGSLASLRPRGMMVTFGQSSGPVPPFNVLDLSTKGSLFLTRSTLASYVATHDELVARAGSVLGAIAKGELAVRIHQTFPLEAAADAQRLLEGRGTSGKVLLRP